MTERERLHPHIARERLHDAPKAKRRAKAAARHMAFTEARVAGLRPRAKQYLTWDRNDPEERKQESVSGLAVLTQVSGFRSYYAHFNLPRQPGLSKKLGIVGEMKLEEARQLTREIRKKAAQGIDPRAGDNLEARIAALEELLAKLKGEKQMADLEVAERVTLSQLVDDWHREALSENKSAREVRSLVHYHTKAWAARPALKITKDDVKKLLQGIKDGTGDTVRRPQAPTANRLFAHLHTLFTWAVDEEKAGIVVSPMRGVKLPSKAATKPRQRSWFSEDEADAVVKALWELANELGGDREKFLKLLILTGKRRNAVQGMLWENIAADWYWKPSGGSDIKRATPIPLPALAQRVLGKRQNAGKVMHVSGDAAQQLIRTVRTKLELPDKVRERLGLPVPGLGLPDYLHHGLRHIFETRTGELGVKPHTRDLLLDHAIARSRSGKGYDHGAYKAELLEALELWSQHVDKLIQPSEDVVVLR